MNKTRQELKSQFGFEYIDWLNHKKENHRDYLIAKGEDLNMSEQIKKPRLFYWEDAIDAWTPAPDSLESILSLESHFDEDGEVVAIQFKRFDMTDEEYAAIPED